MTNNKLMRDQQIAFASAYLDHEGNDDPSLLALNAAIKIISKLREFYHMTVWLPIETETVYERLRKLSL